MFATLPEVENTVDKFIADGQYNEALANILVGVHNHFKQAEVARKFLYYPNLDSKLEKLSQRLKESSQPSLASSISNNTLIVASEMYDVGGHSRVILDIARETPYATIVLTDMFWRTRNSPDNINWLLSALPNVTIIVLTQLSLWGKCQALYQLTLRLQPKSILYFNHHQDPIPFVGTLAHEGSRKYVVHHCDHNPSLGNTLNDVGHVDFARETALECARHLRRETSVLPLYVPDIGRKEPSSASTAPFSVVTSGPSHKFIRTGDLSLQNIVCTSLDVINGSFFHIGDLDDDWIQEIRAHLNNNAINPERFITLGRVASIWGTLQGIDANLYIGSAPVGGGRTAIEAQGCGYPVAFFKVSTQGTALGISSIYADPSLCWSTLAELKILLRSARPTLNTLSDKARSFYEAQFSRMEFIRAVNQIVAPSSPIES